MEQGREHHSSGSEGRWALEMIMASTSFHRRGGARVPLPLEARGHPLQRWIDDAGAPQPVKPEPRVKALAPAPGGRA